MPSTGTHRYGTTLAPVLKGTVAVVGTLTLPSSGTTTFALSPAVYNAAGIYTLFTFGSLAGGTVANLAVDGSALVGLTVGAPYVEGSAIKVQIS